MNKTVSMGGLNIGCAAFSWSFLVAPQLLINHRRNNESLITNDWALELNHHEMSALHSVINLGALIGSLLGAFLMDIFGRRTTILATHIPSVVGWILITLALDYSLKNYILNHM